MIHAHMNDGITRQHTVWCFACSNWEQASTPTKAAMVRWAMRGGWKRIKKLWHCPACLARYAKEKAKR